MRKPPQDRPVRLDKRVLRAIEDALIQREAAPPDVARLTDEDYDDALAWTMLQLVRRRESPRTRITLSTPLEAWIKAHPRGGE